MGMNEGHYLNRQDVSQPADQRDGHHPKLNAFNCVKKSNKIPKEKRRKIQLTATSML